MIYNQYPRDEAQSKVAKTTRSGRVLPKTDRRQNNDAQSPSIPLHSHASCRILGINSTPSMTRPSLVHTMKATRGEFRLTGGVL